MIAQVLTALLGIFLMVAPGLFGLGQPASDNFHIFGPVITAFAVISWWEATRVVRLWNVPMGAWLIVSPILLSYGSTTAVVMAVGVGAAVTALAFVKGKTEKRYGGGWRAIWRDDAVHQREARSTKTG